MESVCGEQQRRGHRAEATRSSPSLRGSRRARESAGPLVAAFGRGPLTLVVTSKFGTSVRPQRGSVKRHKRELGDLESGIELDWDASEIVQFERQRPSPTGIAETGRRVDDETESA